MSKDVDVALWQDHRLFNSEKPLIDALDFVIVNNELHKQFDDFKKIEVPSNTNFIETNPLLQVYCEEKDVFTVEKYGKTYLKLSSSSIDDLCQWVRNLRKRHKEH